MKKLLPLTLLVSALLSAHASLPSTFFLPERPLVYAIGDSITYGYMVGGPEGSWAKIFSDGVGGIYVNDAKSGSMLSHWYSRLTGNADRNAPYETNYVGPVPNAIKNAAKAADVIVMTLGVNDFHLDTECKRSVDDPDVVAAEMLRFLAALHAENADAKILVVGTERFGCTMPEEFQAYPEYSDKRYMRARCLAYSQKLRTTVNRAPYNAYAAYVDCTDIFMEHGAYAPNAVNAVGDGLHPGYDGATRIAERALSVVNMALPEKVVSPVSTTIATFDPETGVKGPYSYDVTLNGDGEVGVVLDIANLNMNNATWLKINDVAVFTGIRANDSSSVRIGESVFDDKNMSFRAAVATVRIDSATGEAFATLRDEWDNTYHASVSLGDIGRTLHVAIPELPNTMKFRSLSVVQQPVSGDRTLYENDFDSGNFSNDNSKTASLSLENGRMKLAGWNDNSWWQKTLPLVSAGGLVTITVDIYPNWQNSENSPVLSINGTAIILNGANAQMKFIDGNKYNSSTSAKQAVTVTVDPLTGAGHLFVDQSAGGYTNRECDFTIAPFSDNVVVKLGYAGNGWSADNIVVRQVGNAGSSILTPLSGAQASELYFNDFTTTTDNDYTTPQVTLGTGDKEGQVLFAGWDDRSKWVKTVPLLSRAGRVVSTIKISRTNWYTEGVHNPYVSVNGTPILYNNGPVNGIPMMELPDGNTYRANGKQIVTVTVYPMTGRGHVYVDQYQSSSYISDREADFEIAPFADTFSLQLGYAANGWDADDVKIEQFLPEYNFYDPIIISGLILYLR